MQIDISSLKTIFNPKLRPLIGVDIGSTLIRMVELVDAGKGVPRVERYVMEPLPRDAVVDGNMAALESVSDALKRCWTKLGTSTRNVALALPTAAVITKKITLPANLREQESAEVGLLLQGVKDGKFPRPEFQALNATANQYTELRAQYARDGFKPEQVRELSQIQHQYGAMYQRFQADDKVKIRFQGGDRNDPQARFRAEQNEQGGRYYDQFRDQRIDEVAFRALLLEQRAKSSELGVQGQR